MEVKLKPKNKDVLVRDPISKAILAADGEMKELNNFWQRRINDGDVIVVGDQKAEPKKELKKD